MTDKAIKLNTIAHFKGNYIDENKEEAKERRHLLFEKESDDLFFIKFTSQKRKQLNQVRIKLEPELVSCLNLISYPVFNQKIKFSLADLETANYRYFYICSLHSDGCLKPKKFAEICRIFKEIWEDKLTPESDKKIISLKTNELSPTKEVPWWVNYTSKDRKERK